MWPHGRNRPGGPGYGFEWRRDHLTGGLQLLPGCSEWPAGRLLAAGTELLAAAR
jgi:hypothetical protein